MKWQRLLLLLCLVPNLVFGLHQDEYSFLHGKVAPEWKRHHELIEEHNKLKPDDIERRLHLLKESMECCKRALAHCDTILNDIAGKSKSKQKKYLYIKMQQVCLEDTTRLHTEINTIQSVIQELEGHLAFRKAVDLYQKSLEKASQANIKDGACQRRLNNVAEVVATLNEVSDLYTQATSMTREALALVAPHPSRSQDQKDLQQAIENYQGLSKKYKTEAADWPAVVVTQKTALQKKVENLKEDGKLFTEKGLKHSCYELQKQALPLLEKLIECSAGKELEFFKQELSAFKADLAAFEKESDNSRLTASTPVLSVEEFKAREKERKDLFFKSDFLLNPDVFLPENLKNAPLPRVVPLDGQKGKKEGNFSLYTEQFYRFLVQNASAVPTIFVKVHENGQIIHVEKIALPSENTPGWEAYLKNGMLFIPETKLQSDFGLDLRLSFACDPANKFSMIVAQKSKDTRYQFSVSLTPDTSLYECFFSDPPPWQLESLRKPALVSPGQPIDPSPLPSREVNFNDNSGAINLTELFDFPVLNKLVEELKNDPKALASYVQNEIAFVDPYLHQENGVSHASSIHRNPCMTYLEKQGSAWEQCQLLVYLLRKAGYTAVYATGAPVSLPKEFVERMLLTKLAEDQSQALLQYPWVMFLDGKEWVCLFPWMKDMQIQEGHDVYSYMPEEYASANRWILRYLKGDEKILKHIGPDGDDTAGVLFVRFVEETLRKQGLSLNDIGIHRTQVKKQFSSWQDFPHPSIPEQAQILPFLNENSPFVAKLKIEICSHQNPQKCIAHVVSLARLSTGPSFIKFSSLGKNHHQLHLQIAGKNTLPPLILDESDHLVEVKIDYEVILGSQVFKPQHTFSVAKGTTAALCSHFGGASPKMTSQFYEQFSAEKDEKKRLPALLSFVGSSYFEKCSRAEKILASLHKVNPVTVFAFGLSKLSPDLSKGAFKGDEDLVLPQVDMFWFQAGPPKITHPSVWHQEFYTARMQCASLISVDASSNEHQILREVFKDPYAVSTVKLLQLAHQQQQKSVLEGEGFLSFTAKSFEAADKTPEAAQGLYFSHLKDLNLKSVKATSPGQWNALKNLLNPTNPLSSWSIAYMTPGLTFNQNGSYKEMGTLVLSPYTQHALISSNNLIFHGGLGSALPPSYFTSNAIRAWQLVPTLGIHSYRLDLPAQFRPSLSYTLPAITQSLPGTKEWTPDVRPWYKAAWNSVADPIDTVTGAFYIDETDLACLKPFSLTIRRNYNSQNPLIGDLGCGWKLSLNPSLIDQGGKRFAAELDGTIIVYSYNGQTGRWEVFAEDNPELFNFNQQGISPFHSYIENDVLYGADGSKRFYKDSLLQKWVDARGNTLSFSYQKGHLARIESSNGDFCGIHYNHQENISEIYAKDGRRIYYDYDSQGDLVKVTLPNTAQISYEYDRNHRVIRETKPQGQVLENVYDTQGRVKEQRSPMGLKQEMVTTATFEYAEGKTIVTDAEGGKTTYQIHDKQIYKIIDPLGFTTLQAWFIDKESWFDPETAQVALWNQQGGAIRSLKSSTDKRGLKTSYLYDAQGNPELITLKGEDLTGNGVSEIKKKCAYNERNLCIEEKIDEQRTLTTYDATFPYLPKKVAKYSGNTLISYLDFTYNSLGQLEKEDRCGSVTLWHYNDRGLPREKIELTGTEDPDVITTYAYNAQGQCIEAVSAHGIQLGEYDLMGNQTASKILSPSKELLSATYVGYDLNNAPIWKQSANLKNIVYLDYHASGRVKATRQSLTPSHLTAYTLYEYSPCGYLIEETDPRGYVTYRDYDLLGRIKDETKEGHTTHISYEAGGLLETMTSPSGGQLTRHYTTNGLPKEEIYPDGTKSTVVYDFLGRPILETKNAIAWEIKYDDAHHQITRTHLTSKISEISEFDQRGNLIKFTDAAGYTSEKTYDSLNRPKTEISPSGKCTSWNYHDNVVVCTAPSGEISTTHYAGEKAIKSEVSDPKGTLIAVSQAHFNPENQSQEVIEGEEKTITWINALGLPIKVEKGKITASYEYDACGNCISSIDGEGRVTHQDFDGLGRLAQKHLPEGSVLKFVYDADSNLAEQHLPNGNVWKASYDLMRRKVSEELISSKGSSQRRTFSYEDGYLKTTTDPMQRAHTYLYDPFGRVFQDSVDGSTRTYTYEPRGFLATVTQTTETPYGSQSENSLVERSYDADGHLALESIYLNSELIQQTQQNWTANSRSLQIGNHVRDFFYQNNRLSQVSTQHVEASYSYGLSGALKSKNSQLSSATIDYNASGLPETVITRLPESSYQEQLDWYPSGKIHTYTAPGKEQSFSYNERGYLKSTGSEKYDFDFDSVGTGVRTAAPGWNVPQNGLDDFGRILTSVFEKTLFPMGYNAVGEMITHGQKHLSWDPWGRLVKITDPSYLWEASYDAFGRRLQTRYTKLGEQTLITNSFYDPEDEFQEIGVQIGGKTFWKIYGPSTCDAISDEMESVTLIHNALRQLIGIVSPQGTLYNDTLPTAYGPLETAPPIPSDLTSYAQSLSWHSKAQDPTGFIWMGDRYYDSRSGQFLSQDSISYPMCLDPYTYAGGDPINYFDPDGRFASYAYQVTKSATIEAFQPWGLKAARYGCNTVASYLANHESTNSMSFLAGYRDLPNGAIGFVNGINTTNQRSRACAWQLSEYAQGAKIYGTYNATNYRGILPISIAGDVLECGFGHLGFHTPPVQLLINEWTHFHTTHRPDEKFLQISYSGGGIHVYNALMSSPESVRQRVISVAIAPGAIIPEELCYKSYNYMSRRDFVTLLDVVGNLRYGNELTILEPHSEAGLWDHDFLSPTFEQPLRYHLTEYIKNYGGKK